MGRDEFATGMKGGTQRKREELKRCMIKMSRKTRRGLEKEWRKTEYEKGE